MYLETKTQKVCWTRSLKIIWELFEIHNFIYKNSIQIKIELIEMIKSIIQLKYICVSKTLLQQYYLTFWGFQKLWILKILYNSFKSLKRKELIDKSSCGNSEGVLIIII